MNEKQKVNGKGSRAIIYYQLAFKKSVCNKRNIGIKSNATRIMPVNNAWMHKWMTMYMSERMKKGMEKRIKKRSRYMIG